MSTMFSVPLRLGTRDVVLLTTLLGLAVFLPQLTGL
jgi:hypothetical protein